MKLLASLTSPYARKIRVVLMEKRIEVDLIEENIWSAETNVTLHNPLTKIPVLILDDGTSLYDSRVIAEFLDGITPVTRLIPEGGRERAMVKRLEALGDGIADAGIAIFIERKRDPAQQSQEWIARQMGKLESAIAALARELGDRKFCQGENMNIGDVSAACAILWLQFRLPEIKWRDSYPNLKAWIERLEARVSFIETKPPGA